MKPILIIQNCQIESAGTILEYLNQNSVLYQVFHSYTKNQFPDIENFSAVINLGCPTSVVEYQQHDFLQNLYAYVANIVKVNKPYLGICFGGQILAKVLGASVGANKVKEIGTYKIALTDEGIEDSLFYNISTPFQAFHWHGDTFQIPFGATLLATSKDCHNQAFRKNRAVGIQFHFEADICEVPLWCDAYSDELIEFGRTKDEILSEYNNNVDAVKANNFQLIENFLTTI